MIRPLLIGIIVLASCGLCATRVSAQAKDVYITPDGGGNGACTTNVHPPSWFNDSANWGSGGTQIGPGTTVHLCGTLTTSLSVRGSGVGGQPITVLFESNAKISVGSCGSACINLGGNSWITIDGGSNGVIEATNSGTGLGNAASVGIYARGGTTNSEIKNLAIINMYIHNGMGDGNTNGYHAIWIDGHNNSIHNNTIHDTDCGICEEVTSSNDVFYSNTIYNANWGIFLSGGPAANSITNESVHDNDIHDFGNWDTTTDTFHHDGIFASGSNTSGTSTSFISIYNNYLHGVMSNCPANCMTAYIYVNAANNISIYNNLVVPPTGQLVYNGLVTLGAGTYNDHIYKIFNNTVIGGDTSGGGGACFSLNGIASVSFENNISSNCTYLLWSRAGTSYTVLDRNVYQKSTSQPFRKDNSFYDFGPWKAAIGADANSQYTSGSLNLSGNYKPLATSIAVSAGANLTSLGITALNSDKAGIARHSSAPWDAGAHQSGGGSQPAAPTGLVVTIQ
jgi:hypothetical protein